MKKAEREYREVTEVRDGETLTVIYCDRMGCPGSTGLRCYRTGVPICKKCSVRTPVGYLSVDAAREQQSIFFNARSTDYVLAAITAFMLSLVAGYFIGQFWFIFAFVLSVPAGGIISEAVFRVLRKRRGRYTAQVVSGAMVLAVLALFLFAQVNLFSLLIFGFLATGAATARFQLGLRL